MLAVADGTRFDLINGAGGVPVPCEGSIDHFARTRSQLVLVVATPKLAVAVRPVLTELINNGPVVLV